VKSGALLPALKRTNSEGGAKEERTRSEEKGMADETKIINSNNE
jgi:hypothetical protein